MHIQVDADTTGVELFHLSILFQSLAGDRGFAVPKPERAAASQTQTVGEMSVTLNVDTANATSAVEALADLIDRTGVKVEDVPPVTVSGVVHPVDIVATVETPEGYGDVKVIDPVAPPTNNDKLDIDGLPWDARIHSGSRERNANGKWRTARKPKALTEEQWQETLTRVNAELRDLMDIPVSTGAVADAAAEEALTDAEVDQLVEILEGIGDIPVATGAGLDAVIEQREAIAPPVTIAPPVVVPPVTAVAPPITVDKPAIETFPQVMVWLTAHTPKDEAAKPGMVTKVNQILTDNGLTVLQQLNQRPDLIPQIMSQFIEAFGND
jgi:hypothetical protein